MIKFIQGLEKTMQAEELKLEKLLDTNIQTVFSLGTTTFDVKNISDNQLIYAFSVYNSRLLGAKASRIPQLIETSKQEFSDFKKGVVHYNKIKLLKSIISDNKSILRDAQSLLLPEEKRQMFLDKHKS